MPRRRRSGGAKGREERKSRPRREAQTGSPHAGGSVKIEEPITIKKLAETKKGKEAHIPFRDSKLTRLLQNSLGGNAKTLLFVMGSPHEDNEEETVSTLQFAGRARHIKNVVTAAGAQPDDPEGSKL